VERRERSFSFVDLLQNKNEKKIEGKDNFFLKSKKLKKNLLLQNLGIKEPHLLNTMKVFDKEMNGLAWDLVGGDDEETLVQLDSILVLFEERILQLQNHANLNV
jgi:hypothetical protein